MQRKEPTLNDLLGDPIVRLLLHSDGIGEDQIRAFAGVGAAWRASASDGEEEISGSGALPSAALCAGRLRQRWCPMAKAE